MGEIAKLSAARQRRLVRGGLRLLGVVIAASGALAAWLNGNGPPGAVPELARMGLAAAASACLMGLALSMASFEGRASTRSAQIIAALALVLAGLSLARAPLPIGAGAGLERMPPGAAIGFALLSSAILIAKRMPGPSQLLALFVAGLGFLTILGRLYRTPALYDQPWLGPLAPPTAVLLMATAAGVLFLRPERGLPAALRDSSEAGRELRRLASAALLPVLLGWVVLTGRDGTWYQESFGTALLVIAFMLGLLGLSYWSYASLRESESERRRARAELAASEERYRRTFEHARIGIAHVAPDGRWLRVNERLVEILGYEAPELLRKTYSDVSHLEDLEIDVKHWELLRRGEITDYAVERRFQTKNGEIVHADVRIAREEDESGRLRHFIVVLQDVTARKLSEGTRRVYERALAATQSGVVITDARADDQPIVYANPAFSALTGYSSAELVGKNCRILNQQAREQPALDELRKAIAAGQACSVLLRNHRMDGEPFWNQLSIAPIEDPSGQLTHFVGVMIDATERIEGVSEREELLAAAQSARREAESANRAKDRFLSVVSHELRSPLNAILAWTSLLRDEPGGEVARVVRAIEASVHSQSRMVNELLDASRIREGTLQIEPVRVDLEPVVRSALTRLAPIASEKEIALEIAAQGPAFVIADAERIEQVVRNLVDNALKFTPKGGRVDVALSEANEHWRIDVRDTGAGIPADALPHVFQEFWQADRKSSTRGAGLGLGLLIVKHLVERHGGSVRIESEGKDRGTSVRVELPKPRRTLPAAAGATGSGDLKGVEVVVVDDDDATVAAIGLALAKAGAICRLATSVSEALRFFERGTPEVLVSDIGLPDRDGFDLIRAVRRLGEPNRSTLAIAVSGLVEPEERRRIRRAGFDSYLAKPVGPDVVIDRIIRLRIQREGDLPPRRVLILEADAAAGAELAAELQKQGHEVRLVREPVAAVRQAMEFQPHVVLARATAELDAAALAERLAGRGVHAELVGLGDDGLGLEQKGFDRTLGLPVELDALDRLLRFTEGT